MSDLPKSGHYSSSRSARCRQGQESDLQQPDWSDLVDSIRSGMPNGIGHLYRTLAPGTRFLLVRAVGEVNAEDLLHNVLFTVIQAIRNGSVLNPGTLLASTRTAIHGEIAGLKQRAAKSLETAVGAEQLRPHNTAPDPEVKGCRAEEIDAASEALRQLSPRDREALERFYVRGQSLAEICGETALSEAQFRLIKSQAKVLFDACKRKRLPAPPRPRAPLSWFSRKWSEASLG